MARKLNKNFRVDSFTVESMSCKMECTCSCAEVCNCTTTGDYYAFTEKPTNMSVTGEANTDFNLEWKIQAL